MKKLLFLLTILITFGGALVTTTYAMNEQKPYNSDKTNDKPKTSNSFNHLIDQLEKETNVPYKQNTKKKFRKKKKNCEEDKKKKFKQNELSNVSTDSDSSDDSDFSEKLNTNLLKKFKIKNKKNFGEIKTSGIEDNSTSDDNPKNKINPKQKSKEFFLYHLPKKCLIYAWWLIPWILLAGDACIFLAQVEAQVKALTTIVNTLEKMGIPFGQLATKLKNFDQSVHDSAFNIFNSNNKQSHIFFVVQVAVTLAIIAFAIFQKFIRVTPILHYKVANLMDKLNNIWRETLGMKKQYC